jgi:hypothetical protein
MVVGSSKTLTPMYETRYCLDIRDYNLKLYYHKDLKYVVSANITGYKM